MNYLTKKCYLAVFLASVFLLANHAHAQNMYGIVIQTDGGFAPAGGDTSENQVLNQILTAFDVISYESAYPMASSENAKNCFRIVLEPSSSDDYPVLKHQLETSNLFSEVLLEEDVPVTCGNPFVPNDPGAQSGSGYYINSANLPCAWEITQGDPDIAVAIVDIFLDNNHSDLAGKVADIQFANPSLSDCGHGFASAGAVSAIVNNGICVAGSGFNTKVAFYACGAHMRHRQSWTSDTESISRWANNHKRKFFWHTAVCLYGSRNG